MSGPSDRPLQPPPPVVTLTTEDAKRLVDAVRETFSEQPHKYTEFLEILSDFKSERLSTEVVADRVQALFEGHPILMVGFNAFLPLEDQIMIGSKAIARKAAREKAKAAAAAAAAAAEQEKKPPA